MDSQVLYIGRTNFRNEGRRFGIRRGDLRFHMLLIGKTGTGKSTLMKNLVYQDIGTGGGCLVLDPHGDLYEDLKMLFEDSGISDLRFLDASKADWSFNPLDGGTGQDISLRTAGLVEVFKKLWLADWGPRLEHILRHTLASLMEIPGASLIDIPRFLTDDKWRALLISRINNPVTKAFWVKEFGGYSSAMRSVVTAPILNKVGALLFDDRLRKILSGRENRLDVTAMLAEGQAVVVNLSKGKLGEGPSALLGSLLVSQVALAGLARANLPHSQRRSFTVYIDEAQSVATVFLAQMLSELRKYGIGLVLANQFLGQYDSVVRDAILGNVGSLVVFRVGQADAVKLSQSLGGRALPGDLLQLSDQSVFLKLGSIDQNSFTARLEKDVDLVVS